MNTTCQAQSVFQTHSDYLQIAKAFFAIAGIYLPGDPFFQNPFSVHQFSGLPPYAREILYVLNNPDVDFEKVKEDFFVHWTNSETYTKTNFERYEKEIIEILITVVNALRHKVKPAHISY
jgi:hypothetical protein